MIKLAGQRGFTLIEIISVIVVMAIIGVIAGMSLLKITEGFVFAKKNAATTQKGQIAMARLLKELNSVKSISYSPTKTMTTIKSGGQTSITLSRTIGVTTTDFTIAQSGNNLQIGSDTLVDNVNTFELKYYNTYNGSSSSTYSSTACVIEISLKLTGADNVISEFLDRVTL